MAAIWPLTLPQVSLISGYQDEGVDDTLRSQVDAGAPMARPLTTGLMTKVMIPLLLTNAQKQILRDFYTQTLAKGSLRFEWSSYHTGNVTKEHFFNAMPQYTQVSHAWWGTTLDLIVFGLG